MNGVKPGQIWASKKTGKERVVVEVDDIQGYLLVRDSAYRHTFPPLKRFLNTYELVCEAPIQQIGGLE